MRGAGDDLLSGVIQHGCQIPELAMEVLVEYSSKNND
jgi:hypothetical protein